MQNKTVVSITFNLEESSDYELWKYWIDDAKHMINILGYTTTHIGFSSAKYTSGKVIALDKAENRIAHAINQNDGIKYISAFSLPDNYKSASFDFNVLVVKSLEYVTIIANKSDRFTDKQAELISVLRKYTGSSSGEIFEMDKSEFPLSYAAKANPVEHYSSLKVIGKIE